MSSPEVAPANVAARNPRRRQRNTTEDSVINRQPAKRIRRAGLTSDTFKVPTSSQATEHSALGGEGSQTNGHVPERNIHRHDNIDSSSLAIRHKGLKKAERERRSSKSDGSIELVNLHPLRRLAVLN